MEKMSATEIMYKVGMVGRASYYAGYGPREDCLGAKHLTEIHAIIKEQHGEDAALAFCMMVEQIKELSPSEFVNQFQIFGSNGFRLIEVHEEGRSAHVADAMKNPKTGEYETSAGGMGAFFALLGDRSSPEMNEMKSRGIKREFFHRVEYTPATKEADDFPNDFELYGRW